MALIYSAFFVVSRELFEAFLILFLIRSVLVEKQNWQEFKPTLYSGVGFGLLLSGACAWVMVSMEDITESSIYEIFQAILPLVAVALILHMVFWMAHHAKKLKGDLQKTETFSKMSLFLIVSYSIAREGFETVVYLYGISLNPMHKMPQFAYPILFVFGALFAGVILKVLVLGLKAVSLKQFFLVTNILLVGTAASLLVTGINSSIESGFLPSGINPLWNSSAWISGDSWIGQILNLSMGYTPAPSQTLVICYVLFWALLLVTVFKKSYSQSKM